MCRPQSRCRVIGVICPGSGHRGGCDCCSHAPQPGLEAGMRARTRSQKSWEGKQFVAVTSSPAAAATPSPCLLGLRADKGKLLQPPRLQLPPPQPPLLFILRGRCPPWSGLELLLLLLHLLQRWQLRLHLLSHLFRRGSGLRRRHSLHTCVVAPPVE